jgi:hypothetical protein
VNEYGKKDEKSVGKSKQKMDYSHLIPMLACCHFTGLSDELIAINPRPNEWSVGSVCTCCSPWWVCSMTGLKMSDVQGECCLLAQCSLKEIQPFQCCMCAVDALPVMARCAFPRDADYDNRDVPCLCNLAGCNICLDGNFRCGFMQSIKTLREGHWICPACPCVLGSCANLSFLYDCCSACAEFCTMNKGANNGRVETEFINTKEGEDSPTKELKAEKMARESMEFAKKEGFKQMQAMGNGGADQIGKTRTRDLYPCLGLLCCMSSLQPKMPGCLGGYCEGLVLMIAGSCTCCQPMLERGDKFTGDVFLCCEERLSCVCPRTLLSCQYSCPFPLCCCLDHRCAIPCDGLDMPCILNILFVNCCFKCRPTCHCTYFAPLAQFYEDYDGEKYTVCDFCCMGIRAMRSCGQTKNKKLVTDEQNDQSVSPAKESA